MMASVCCKYKGRNVIPEKIYCIWCPSFRRKKSNYMNHIATILTKLNSLAQHSRPWHDVLQATNIPANNVYYHRTYSFNDIIFIELDLTQKVTCTKVLNFSCKLWPSKKKKLNCPLPNKHFLKLPLPTFPITLQQQKKTKKKYCWGVWTPV